MAKLLAVALERAERAQPDAALAHVHVAARLHVHRQVLLDDEALLAALGARERLVAGDRHPLHPPTLGVVVMDGGTDTPALSPDRITWSATRGFPLPSYT